MKNFKYVLQYPAMMGTINLNVLFKYEGWRHPTTKASHFLDELEIIEYQNPDIDIQTIIMDNVFDFNLGADVYNKLIDNYTSWKAVENL